MGAIFSSLGRTLVAGVVILVVIMLIAGTFGKMGEMSWWTFFFRWIHVLAGVMWIGLLWYFNFVQTPALAAAAADELLQWRSPARVA